MASRKRQAPPAAPPAMAPMFVFEEEAALGSGVDKFVDVDVVAAPAVDCRVPEALDDNVTVFVGAAELTLANAAGNRFPSGHVDPSPPHGLLIQQP
jgi:hypothetical protein